MKLYNYKKYSGYTDFNWFSATVPDRKKQPPCRNCPTQQPFRCLKLAWGTQLGHAILLLDIISQNINIRQGHSETMEKSDKTRNTSKFCLNMAKKTKSLCNLQNTKHPPLLVNMSDCYFSSRYSFSFTPVSPPRGDLRYSENHPHSNNI